MIPNLLNNLPIHVISIDRDRADYALSRNRISDYFLRNTLLYQRALDPSHTSHAVQMAAHTCGLWFSEWQNPDNGYTLLIIANKESMPLKAMFTRALVNPMVIEALKRWS